MHQAPGAEAPKIRTDAAASLDATDFFGDALTTAMDAEMSPSDSAATLTGPLPGAKNAHVLSNEIKAFIVRGLARYQTPYEVADAVAETFGIEVSRQRVHAYNPNGAQPPSKRWCDLHAATRQAFLKEAASVGVAHKVARLKLLDLLTERAIANNKTRNAAVFLEQAAKECGGIYERKPRRHRETTSADPSGPAADTPR